MRWPWSRRAPVRDPAPAHDDSAEAVAARQRAEEALQRAHEQTPEIRDLADRLRQHRRVNHFAELFGQTLRGPK